MAGGLNNFAVQEGMASYLQTCIPHFVVKSGAIPNGDSMPLVNGVLEPFIILRFSEPSPGAGAFGGPKYDEYSAIVDVLSFGATDTDARDLSRYADTFMLGHKFNNTSALGRAPGNSDFTIFSDANRQPVAFVCSKAYRYQTNVERVAEF